MWPADGVRKPPAGESPLLGEAGLLLCAGLQLAGEAHHIGESSLLSSEFTGLSMSLMQNTLQVDT